MMKSIMVATTVASTLLVSACGDSDGDRVANALVSSAGSVANDATAQNGQIQTQTKTNTAVDAAVATPELSILVEAVVAAGLADTLSGPGPFTIFAPTNDAFVALLGELGVSKDALLADTDLLTTVLTYHVLDSTVKAADVPVGQAITPLAGSAFKIEAMDNGLVITDGRNRTGNITATDIMTDNAVIHLIDRVILPADKNIVQTAVSNPDFSILVEAVLAADLADTLSGAGPFTVFAPTNAAFADLLDELGITKDALLADTALLTKVLTYHVVPGQVLKVSVPIDQPIKSVQGDSLSVNAGLSITDARGRAANIVATDILNTNGVIHVIDRVILPAADMQPQAAPSSTIVDVALSNPDFSILVEAVVAAGLADTLSGDGPFTVFAPTNDAFTALLHELHISKETLLNDTQQLRHVLLYHVLGAKVLAADVPVDSHIGTVQGGNISIDAHFRINDAKHRQAQIVATDIEADNGVIHAIDRVLLPF